MRHKNVSEYEYMLLYWLLFSACRRANNEFASYDASASHLNSAGRNLLVLETKF